MSYDELMEAVDQVREAQEQIAEAAATLRAVADETTDIYRATHMVANLEALVGAGGWMVTEAERLQTWIDELEERAQEAEVAERFQMVRQTR